MRAERERCELLGQVLRDERRRLVLVTVPTTRGRLRMELSPAEAREMARHLADAAEALEPSS